MISQTIQDALNEHIKNELCEIKPWHLLVPDRQLGTRRE